MSSIEKNLAFFMQNSPQTNIYKLGELFVGAGGMAFGAHKAKVETNGFMTVWANDNNQDACNTLVKNLPILEEQAYCCSVSDLDFPSLSKIDGLCFGFPCNDFSVVGNRKGISGQFGGLYKWGVKALECHQPSFFVAENVGGLSSSGEKKDIQIIFSALKNAGYDIFPNVYKFEQYGVPQNRHRMIIVGFHKSLNINFIHPDGEYQTVTAQEALQGISDDAPNHEWTKQSKVVVERLKHIKQGENAFTADLPEHLKLNLKSKATISQIYKRLKADEPAYTVTGSGGGGTHIYHWSENRALTNRERARIQSFPDTFIFAGGKESVRRQIGMAVPPKGAQIIFTQVLKTLLDHGIQPC